MSFVHFFVPLLLGWVTYLALPEGQRLQQLWVPALDSGYNIGCLHCLLSYSGSLTPTANYVHWIGEVLREYTRLTIWEFLPA